MDTDDLLALSVVGPRGIIDLVVPGGATIGHVADEYARQAGLATAPDLLTGLGQPVPAGVPLASTSVSAGDILVAASAGAPPRPAAEAPQSTASRSQSGTGARIWLGVAAAAAVIAGWYAAHLPEGTEQTLTASVLLASAVLGMLPVGRYAAPRSGAAPAFAAAAAYAFVWRPDSLPVTWGIVGLVAALTAATGRSLLPDERSGDGTEARRDEAHLVWIVTGIGLFLVAALVSLLQLSPPVAWSLLLVAAMLAARLVPMHAVDVPDQLLVDFERLAVSAWSAREQPSGRRGRMVIARTMVARIVERGQRIISSAAAAIAVVAAGSSYLLLFGALPGLDRLGAGLLTFFVGGSLLLAAGSYRNLAARFLLRGGGLACWALLCVAVVPTWSPSVRSWVVLAAVVVGLLCIASAVATGRGWRSVWWARRAEVGEAVCGAFAIASLSLSTGLFRTLWELTSR